MFIKRVRIQNFRCLQDVEVYFDDITTFIGPNGVGKSSVLRALDWFFNGDKTSSLTDDDVFSGAPSDQRRISVEVEFHKLTTADREALTKYTSDGVDTVVIWRRWENGVDKITGKALAYPAFEKVREQQGATAQRKAYTELREANPDLGLPSAGSAPAAEAEMASWERQHIDQLQEAEIPGNNLFGFNGQATLSGIFDFILVTADLRANEETQDSKSTILGKILERAVDRSAADTALAELSGELQGKHALIQTEHFGPQLQTISKELSDEVAAFTSGRTVRVSARDVDLKPARTQFRVSVLDDTVETQVDRQGHGFQRALLISTLKLLAQRGAASEANGVICLAIEEPELYQHPVQARAFATVLRSLASDSAQGIQVSYATHSPFFIEPRHFEQVRRITRSIGAGPGAWCVKVSHVSINDICNKLSEYSKPERTKKQVAAACLNSLSEAMFAEKVVLVEGETDQAIIEGCAEHDHTPLSVEGIVVAPAGGKPSLILSHAVLTLLGIPCYILFDGDKGAAERMRRTKAEDKAIALSEANNATQNSQLSKYLSGQEDDWPATQINTGYAVFEDTLETQLGTWWPSFFARKQELIQSGLGFNGKNSLTYKHAAETVSGNIPVELAKLLDKIRRVSI